MNHPVVPEIHLRQFAAETDRLVHLLERRRRHLTLTGAHHSPHTGDRPALRFPRRRRAAVQHTP